MQLKRLFSNYARKAENAVRQGSRTNLGRTGRDSYIDPDRRDDQFRFVMRPNEKTGSFQAQRVNLRDIFRRPIAESIPKLIETSDGLSRAVKIVKNYTVGGYKLDGNPRSKAIIEEFIKEMGKGNFTFPTFLRDMAYGIYVEGASSGELVFSEDGSVPLRMDWVSPFSLGFDRITDPALGEIDIIGQSKNGRNLDVILQDPRNPNDTFFYEPVNRIGTQPFGSSQITPALFGVASLSDLLHMVVQYLQGQVFPKGVYQLDIQPLIDAGYDKDEINEQATIATDLINGKLSAADITQDVVMTTKVLYTLVGSLDKTNINGVELVGEMFERIAQRGTGIPPALYGIRGMQGGLNNDESRVQMLAFFRDVTSWQDSIEVPVTDFFTVILRHVGNTGECRLVLNNNDAEIARILAQVFDIQMTGYTKLKGLGILTEEQLFTKVTEGSTDLNDLEYDPDNISQPQLPQLPEPEPEGGQPDA